jgi:hypothetical protein
VSARCRSCGAPIIWAKTARGSPIPLDASPGPQPNLAPNADGAMVVVPPGSGQHTSHFATCPNAAAHRKGQGDLWSKEAQSPSTAKLGGR